MARRVKCQDTGEYSTSDVAYKASNGRYWSSIAAYQRWEKNKEWRQKSIDLFFEILGYKNGMTIPGVFWKTFAKYEPMGYETVYHTIAGERKNIEWAMHNKKFKSEAGLITYACRILENHMIDYYKTLVSLEQQNVVNQDMDIPQDIVVENRTQGTKDISKFLD